MGSISFTLLACNKKEIKSVMDIETYKQGYGKINLTKLLK